MNFHLNINEIKIGLKRLEVLNRRTIMLFIYVSLFQFSFKFKVLI